MVLTRPHGRWCPACALGGLGVLVAGIALLTSGGGGLGTRLRVQAEALANQRLEEAGFPWAKLEVDGAVGRLHGKAPDESARAALPGVARERLEFMMGLPGVFARLEDGLALPPTQAGPASPLTMRLAQPPDGSPASGAGLDAPACELALGNVLHAVPLSFGRGTSSLSRESDAALDRLGSVLARCSPARITVHGHTDRRGSARANQRLSQLRAQEVLEALRLRGLTGSRHEAVGWGAARPLDDTESEAAYAMNRRIEIKVEADVP